MADGQYSGSQYEFPMIQKEKCAYERNGLKLYIWFKLAYCESKLSHKILAHFEEKYSQVFYWLERDLIEHLIKVSYFVGEKTETQQDYIWSKVTH